MYCVCKKPYLVVLFVLFYATSQTWGCVCLQGILSHSKAEIFSISPCALQHIYPGVTINCYNCCLHPPLWCSCRQVSVRTINPNQSPLSTFFCSSAHLLPRYNSPSGYRPPLYTCTCLSVIKSASPTPHASLTCIGQKPTQPPWQNRKIFCKHKWQRKRLKQFEVISKAETFLEF